MAGMTNYSIDSDVRLKAICTIVVLSVVLAITLNNLVILPLIPMIAATGFGGIYDPLASIGLIGSVSALGVYAFIWRKFDTCLWCKKPFLKLHGIPDLNGTWKGNGKSERILDGKITGFTMTMEITQTFSKIQCKSTFENSASTNHIVGIHGCNAKTGSCVLEFSYLNTAKDASVENKEWDDEHRGFNWIDCLGDEMSGRYFTKREKPTRGYFELTREKAD